MLHPRTRKKVRLVLREEVNQAMQELIPFDRLPSTFGGNANAFVDADQATNLEEEVGAIAAAVWKHATLETDSSINEAEANTCGCYGPRTNSGDGQSDSLVWRRCCFAPS